MKVKFFQLNLLFGVLVGFTILSEIVEHILLPTWRFIHIPLHASVEAFGSVIALIMALLLLNRKPKNNVNLFLAVGFMGMGFLDAFHAMSCTGNSFVFLHSVAAAYGGFCFSLCWIEKTHLRGNLSLRKFFVWVAIIGCILLMIWGYFFDSYLLVMQNEGTFTFAAKALNLFSCGFFIIAAVYFLVDFYKFKKLEMYLLSVMAIFFGLAGITFLYSSVWSMTWWFWHFLRLTAYIVVLAFLLIEYKKTVLDLEVTLFERNKAQTALEKAKEAAEAANRTKSQFLANMSHEIRTPMNAIIGMTDITLTTELSSDQHRYLQIVKTSSVELLSLLNDILDFSKIEADKLDLDKIDFDLRNCLEKTLDTLAPRAAEKGLELAFRIPPNIPDSLIGDPSRLRQIIINLVNNAIKFTEHGQVVMDVQAIERSQEGVSLHFAVSDTGMGINPDKQKYIFEPFSQVDGSLTRKNSGTGLGLAICTQLVKLMDGRIGLESAPGKGSTFHFTVRFGLQTVQKKDALELQSLDKIPVLAVEGAVINRSILQELLSAWGMKPTVVGSGNMALNTLEQGIRKGEPFRLLIIDTNTPELAVFNFVRQLRGKPALADIQILILTSLTQHVNTDWQEIGVAHLAKPIKQSELLHTILTILDKAPVREKPLEQISALHGKGRRILLTEDRLINQELMLIILGEWGYSVTVANNGKEALTVMEEQSFNLVLMDVQMPEMDGFEATAAIRKKEEQTGAHVPIIAMTAHAMKGDRERCLEAGMDGYVSKPIDVVELAKTLQSFLGK